MKAKDINSIRNAALLLEENEINAAYELMKIAYKERPNGKLIKRKLNEYELKLNKSNDQEKIQHLFESGELAIIPIGFRCHTKKKLADTFGFTQASLPFDSGFFPPDSIANVLENKSINFKFSKQNESIDNHTVCIKYEGHINDDNKKGIKFISSSYHEINKLAQDKNDININKYLDSTFGYYTLDIKNKFVLAHYNWHQFANINKSKGVYDIEKNLESINNILNHRIKRMYEKCNKAKYILFVSGEFQDYEYMTINDEDYSLNNFNYLSTILNKNFGNKSKIVKFQEINTPKKILNMII